MPGPKIHAKSEAPTTPCQHVTFAPIPLPSEAGETSLQDTPNLHLYWSYVGSGQRHHHLLAVLQENALVSVCLPLLVLPLLWCSFLLKLLLKHSHNKPSIVNIVLVYMPALLSNLAMYPALLSVCSFVHLSSHPSVQLCVCLSPCLAIYLSTCLPVYLSLCQGGFPHTCMRDEQMQYVVARRRTKHAAINNQSVEA